MLNAVEAFNGSDTKVFDFRGSAAPSDSETCITVPDAHLLFSGEFKRVGTADLKIVGEDGTSFYIENYFAPEKRATLMSPEGATIRPEIVAMLAGPLAPGQSAQAGAQQPAAAQPVIGRVDAITGSATVVRNGVTVVLNVGDNVRKGDVVQTSGGSSCAIVLADGSTFSLTANARMVMEDFAYNAGGSGNSAVISLVQGAFSFVAGQVAKTGEMRVDTPVATMGIRGTAVLVEISASDGRTKFSVMVEPDGTTGSFNLYNKTTGALIGTVNNSQVGWVVTPAGPLQVIAQQVQKTPAELQQELGIVQQIFNIFNNNQQNPFVPPQQDQERRGDKPNDANPQNAQGPGGSGSPIVVNVPVTTPENPTPTNVTVTITPVNPTTTTGEGTANTPPPDGTPTPAGPPPPSTPPINVVNSDAPYIEGTDGIDRITGGDSSNTISAKGDNDFVFAEGGDDTIIAGHGEGDDFYDGGEGHDTITFTSAADGIVFNLNSGTFTSVLTGTVKSSTAQGATTGLDTFIRIEEIIAGDGNDVFILHDDGDWVIDAGGGIDIVRLANGVDILDVAGGPDISDFEILDLATDAAQNIVYVDVGDFDSIGNGAPLRILGGSNDVINITNHFGIGAQFVPLGTFTDPSADGQEGDPFNDHFSDGVTFRVFEVTVAGETFNVYLQHGMQVDLPPVASDDLVQTTEDHAPITIDVTLNDIDDQDALEAVNFSSLSDPSLGTLTYIGNGQFSFTPAKNASGTATFTYQVSDGELTSVNTATVTINVAAVNDAPEVFWEPAPVAIPSGTPLHVAGMQFDDVDAGGGEAFTVTVSVTHGSVDFGDAFEGAQGLLTPLDLDGTDGTIAFSGPMAAINQILAATGEHSSAFVYTPAAGYAGAAALTFTVADELGASDSASLAITVEANEPPTVVASAPSTALVEDSVLQSTAQITLTDPEGQGVAYDLTGWVPTALVNTQAYGGHFYLFVSTGEGMSWNAAQLAAAQMGGHLATITSEGENDFIFDNVVAGHISNGSTVAYLGGARNPGDETWRWYHGNEDGQIFYDGDAANGYANWRAGEPNNSSGNESILVMEGDGTWNDADGFYRAAAGFVVEFSDLSNYTLWQTGFGLTYGNVVLNTATGQLTYNLDNSSQVVQNLTASDHATDQVTIRAVDAGGAAGSTTVTFSIDGANENQPPVANNDSVTINEDSGPVSINVALNDTDDLGVALQAVNVSALSNPALGTLISNGFGQFTFTPGANASGSATFTYQASDGALTSTGAATVTINVTPVNDRPVLIESASPSLAAVSENAGAPSGAVGTLVSSLIDFASVEGGLNNVTDVDAGALTGIAIYAAHATYGTLHYSTDNGANWSAVGSVSDASALLLAADANTRLYFQPNAGFSGTLNDAILFRAWDQTEGSNGGRLDIGAGGANTTSVSGAPDSIAIDVTAVNDAPVVTAADDEGSVSAGGTISAVAAGYLAADHDLIDGLGGDSGFGEDALAANDDGSTGAIDITSVFGEGGLNFFGKQFSSIYINNNGNITFNGPLSTFTPSQIAGGAGNPIIAPFWADVDTRGGTATPTPGGESNGSNLIHYNLDAENGVVTITWDDVGYFNSATNLLNAFQLQLIDRGDGNFDIVFRYEDVNWTTGNASGGSGGLGGTPARAGYSAGDGNPEHYFELAGSGDQASMLALEDTAGNTGEAGVHVFQVRSGNVSAPVTGGTIAFTDPETTDTHTVSSAFDASESTSGTALGTLSASVTRDTASGQGGLVTWQYTVDPDLVNALAPGTVRHEVFNITIGDGHGGIVIQPVTITLNGPEASPVELTVHTGDGFSTETLYQYLFSDAATEITPDHILLQYDGDPENPNDDLYFDISAENLETEIIGGEEVLSGGTITGIEATRHIDGQAIPVVTFTGFHIDAVELMLALNLYDQGDPSGLDAIFGSHAYHATGGEGADILTAGDADDVIDGGGGNDTVSGEGGDDRLTGGEGSDIFVFEAGFGHDTILDFVSGADSIQVGPALTLLIGEQLIEDIVEIDGEDAVIEVGNDSLRIAHVVIEGQLRLTANDFNLHMAL